MSLSNRHVIAIDDTPSIRTFLRVSLEDEGVQFHEAASGLEGIELCNSIKPDLVVLDLGLPDMDGMQVLPEIKKPNGNGHSPHVIVLTVRKGKEIMDEAFKLGADGYLTKPFMVDELLELLETTFQD